MLQFLESRLGNPKPEDACHLARTSEFLFAPHPLLSAQSGKLLILPLISRGVLTAMNEVYLLTATGRAGRSLTDDTSLALPASEMDDRLMTGLALRCLRDYE